MTADEKQRRTEGKASLSECVVTLWATFVPTDQQLQYFSRFEKTRSHDGKQRRLVNDRL